MKKPMILVFVVLLCGVGFCINNPIIEYNNSTDTITCQRSSTTLDDDFASVAANTAKTSGKVLVSDFASVRVVADYWPFGIDTTNGVVLCLQQTLKTTVATTVDGTSFTTIANKANAPFSTFQTACTAAGYGTALFYSCNVLPDGQYIVCMAAPGVAGNGTDPVCTLYKYDPNAGTPTWTAVGTMMFGYVPQFGWTAVDGDNIAVVEYGVMDAVNGVRNTYLSTDCGDTWSLIYTATPSAQRHIHCCAFDPTVDHTKIWVFAGDGAGNETYYIEKVGETWQRTGANSYPFVSQPTAAYPFGSSIYVGSDGSNMATICRFDPTDGTLHPKMNIPSFTTNGPGTLDVRQNNGYVFGITKCATYYFAGAIAAAASKNNIGIFISPDLEHWAALHRFAGTDINDGYRTIVGPLNGLLFAQKSDDSALKMEVFTEPSCRLINADRCYPAITNQCDTPSDSLETAAAHNYTTEANYSITAVARSQSAYAHGASSLRATCHYTGGHDTGMIYGPRSRTHVGWTPAQNDYVTLIGWLKKTPEVQDSWGINPVVKFNTGTMTEDVDIDTTAMAEIPIYSNDWMAYPVVCKILQDINDDTKYIWYRLTVNDLDATDTTDTYFYLDNVMYLSSATMTFETIEFFTAGAQAEEYLIGSALESGTAWTVTTNYWPGFEYNSVRGGQIGILEVKDGGVGYVQVYWKQSDKKYYAYNGTDTLSSTETYEPRTWDNLKVAVIGTSAGTIVRIFDPINGLVTLGDNTTCALAKQPAVVTLGKTSADNGFGYYNYLRVFDSALSESDTERSFDKLTNYLYLTGSGSVFGHRR